MAKMVDDPRWSVAIWLKRACSATLGKARCVIAELGSAGRAAMATVDDTVEMMKFMAQQITRLIEAQTAAADKAAQNANNNRTPYWDQIEKFKNLKTFSGDSREWDEFATKFRSQIAAGDGQVAVILDAVETEMKEAEVEEADWSMVADERFGEEKLKEVTEKLHNVLLSLTTGEANAVVRRCRRNGLWAWKRLCTTLNPRTLASGIKAISQALSPGKISSGAKADTAIDTWEHHLAKLGTEYGEEISAKMKVAVLYSMLPKDLQEKVLDKCAVNWDGVSKEEAVNIYIKVRDEVKNIAKSRRDMITPKPMEVDHVQANWGWWEDEGKEELAGDDARERDEHENEINFVGNFAGKGYKGKGKGKCWTCGEAGHRAAECPKGKGKGGGWHNKGGYKGDGKNGKGEGKTGKGSWTTTTPRACFGCGSMTHLVKDCPNNRVTQQVQEVRGEPEEPEVLFIAHTTVQDRLIGDSGKPGKKENAEEQWQQVGRKTGRTRETEKHEKTEVCARPPGLSSGCRGDCLREKTFKGFRVLQEDEPDEEEPMIVNICTVEADGGKADQRKVKNSGAKRVENKIQWASLGVGDIVVDSAAGESCWPKDLGGAFETKPSKKNIILKTANGGETGHYGEKEITFKRGNDDEIVGLKFQVTDAKKPLLAARRLVERGNAVSFGPEPDQNYVLNAETGRKIGMEKRGGAFAIKAHFVKDVGAGFARQAR